MYKNVQKIYTELHTHTNTNTHTHTHIQIIQIIVLWNVKCKGTTTDGSRYLVGNSGCAAFCMLENELNFGFIQLRNNSPHFYRNIWIYNVL